MTLRDVFAPVVSAAHRAMKASMLRLGEYLQVLRRRVKRVAVDVVDYLIAGKFPGNLAFDNKSVIVNLPPANNVYAPSPLRYAVFGFGLGNLELEFIRGRVGIPVFLSGSRHLLTLLFRLWDAQEVFPWHSSGNPETDHRVSNRVPVNTKFVRDGLHASGFVLSFQPMFIHDRILPQVI